MKLPSDLRALFYYGSIDENWLGHIMAEVYKDHVYRPFLPFNKEGRVAIDIGANIGIVALYLSKYFEKVYAVEPSSEHYDALVRNIQSNKATNVFPINKAIYIKSGKFPLGGPSDNKTMRGLHRATWQDGKSIEEVATVTIDEFFEEQKIFSATLMKIDIEGSEVEVFSSRGFKKIAKKIETIVGERHQWSGRHPHQMDSALRDNGFSVEPIKNDTSGLFVARRI